MRIEGVDRNDRCAGDGDCMYYARVPEKLKDADGERVNMAATIDDPRNWKGSRGQKLQAVLKCLLRQWNASENGTTTNSFKAKGRVKLKQIKAETGIDPRTAVDLLDELVRLGIVKAIVNKPGTRGPEYQVGLWLRSKDWNLPHIHTWTDPKPRGMPF